jgi:signal transduction histidine kinase
VTVADTGIGMSSAMVVALLQRGTIRQRRGTDGEPGTGLGLGLCGRLVDRHGGILSIDSAEGNGSAFSILFPDGGPTDVDRP